MIVAVYRILYGEDFIAESVRSVLPFVDDVYVFWTDRTWGPQVVSGSGEPMDGWKDGLVEARLPAMLVYDHVPDPMNQYTHLANDVLRGSLGVRPDEILFVEPDHVFRSDQLAAGLEELRSKGLRCASFRQVEMWRNDHTKPCRLWCIPERPERTGAVLWSLRGDLMPPTRRQGEPVDGPLPRLDAYVHNLGFCVSEKTMRLKHECALWFSKAIGDSIPNDRWVDEKWLSWDPETNNRDLEISRGYEHTIPYAVPYTGELPEVLQ